MKGNTTIYKERKFLTNDKSRSATIISNFSVETFDLSTVGKSSSKQYVTAYGGIRISDCVRSIALDFDSASKKQLRDSLKKIDILINTLVASRQALIKSNQLVNKLRKT